MDNSDTLFNEILANRPSPETVFLILSRMKEEGLLNRVIQECLKVLDAYPNDIYIRRLLAESYFESDQITEASSELEKVIAQIDGSISLYNLQTEIFLRQKKEEEAIKALKLYLAHRPNDQDALNLLDTLQASGESSAKLPPPIEKAPGPATSPGDETVPEIGIPTLINHSDQEHGEEEELKGMLEQGKEEEVIREDRTRQKKRELIAILEKWLENIREQLRTGLSVTSEKSV